MRVYVTGANGNLGTALLHALATDPVASAWDVLGVSISDFDIADATAFASSADDFRPDLVIHLAAIATIGGCDANPRRALAVNVAGAGHAAEAARRHDAGLIYVSTDYVFDGVSPPPAGYAETDVPNPLSLYALTKLAGERIAQAVPRHLIVRTSWLFGGVGEYDDDVLASVGEAQRGGHTRLLADQFSRPTYTADLAAAMIYLISHDVTGTVHVAGDGEATRYDLGMFAVCAVDPVLAEHYAPEQVEFADVGYGGDRPQYSSLDTSKLTGLGFVMPHWQDAVLRLCADLRSGRAGAGQ